MRSLNITILILIALALKGCSRNPEVVVNSVNPIIGDISFIEKYGYAPNSETDNFMRVQTHLAYAEKLLLSKDVSHLTEEQQANRFYMLTLLNEYWKAGVFPRNYDYKNTRKPCFIDEDGRICAVGYLVEQTAGREVAEYINSKFKYEELLAMDDPLLDEWIAGSGLTKDEFATIQPTYGDFLNRPPAKLSVAAKANVAFLGVTSFYLITHNSLQISKGTRKKTLPIFGVVGGSAQVAFGSYLVVYRRDYSWLGYTSMGLGLGSIAVSTWNANHNGISLNSYEWATGLLTGLNASVVSGGRIKSWSANGRHIARSRIVFRYVGLITGAGQLALGATKGYYNLKNPGQTTTADKNMAWTNIGIGSATMALSSYELIKHRWRKNRGLAWNFYSYPTLDSRMAVGFNLYHIL